jgi:hypothetical protein
MNTVDVDMQSIPVPIMIETDLGGDLHRILPPV